MNRRSILTVTVVCALLAGLVVLAQYDASGPVERVDGRVASLIVNPERCEACAPQIVPLLDFGGLQFAWQDDDRWRGTNADWLETGLSGVSPSRPRRLNIGEPVTGFIATGRWTGRRYVVAIEVPQSVEGR